MKEYIILPVMVCLMSAGCAFWASTMNWRGPGRRHKFAIWQLSLGALLAVEAIGIAAAGIFS